MIIIILKTKEVIKFVMETEEKEKSLVNKFSLGGLSQKARLKLPQLKKTLQLSEILDIRFLDHRKATREQELKSVHFEDWFSDIFGK